MLCHDTSNPMRILTAVKLAVLGFIANFGLVMLMNNRGEVGDGTGGDGAGDGQGGDVTGKWTDKLPPEIKSHPVLNKYKDSTEAIKALVEAQSLIGADKIIIPSKDAKEDEWNIRVWDRLGRPKDPKEYALPTDLQIPKDLPMAEKLIENFKVNAHKLGLLPHQVAGMYKWFMSEQIADFTNHQDSRTKAMQDGETNLRRDWGAAYDQNVALARKIVNKFASPETVQLLAEGLGNDPRVVRMFADIGKVLSEDQLVGKPRNLTFMPEEALAEIAKIKGDKKHAYWDDKHPEHNAAVEKMMTLMEMAYPQGQ